MKKILLSFVLLLACVGGWAQSENGIRCNAMTADEINALTTETDILIKNISQAANPNMFYFAGTRSIEDCADEATWFVIVPAEGGGFYLKKKRPSEGEGEGYLQEGEAGSEIKVGSSENAQVFTAYATEAAGTLSDWAPADASDGKYIRFLLGANANNNTADRINCQADEAPTKYTASNTTGSWTGHNVYRGFFTGSPVQFAETVESITKWYYLKLNGKYIQYTGVEELVEWRDTNVPSDEIDSHLWGFVGNPLATKVVSKANTGYAIASTTFNKEGGADAEGVKACAYEDATEYIITCNNQAATNTNSRVSFCLRKPNENYLNGKGAGYVGQWNVNGPGSTFNAEEYEETVVAVSEAANYATLVLDYNAIIPEGVVAYVVSGNNETSATLEEVEGILPANTGVVLKNAGNHTFKKVCAAASTVTIESNFLFGYTDNTPVSESEHADTGENGTVYALAKGDAGVAFYHYTGKNYLAGKAYLQVSNDSGARSLVFNFNDDNATAIENLETTNEKQQSEGCEIYDLTGRRLQGVQKGLYIINGKKIVR